MKMKVPVGFNNRRQELVTNGKTNIRFNHQKTYIIWLDTN